MGLLRTRAVPDDEPARVRASAILGEDSERGISLEDLGLPPITSAMLRLVAVLQSIHADLPIDDPCRVSAGELVVGNLLSIWVNGPSGGFNTLTFQSVPRNKRKSWPPKEDDPRLVVRKLPEKEETKEDIEEHFCDDQSFDIVKNPKSLKNNSSIETVIETNEFQIVMKTKR
jgi:hypothetical protein